MERPDPLHREIAAAVRKLRRAGLGAEQAGQVFPVRPGVLDPGGDDIGSVGGLDRPMLALIVPDHKGEKVETVVLGRAGLGLVIEVPLDVGERPCVVLFVPDWANVGHGVPAQFSFPMVSIQSATPC
jgi:hypothetical protein